MHLPMRQKYVDEHTGGPWFIFGQRPDGTVDVSDANRDVFTELPRDKAEQVVAAHAKFMAELFKILCE